VTGSWRRQRDEDLLNLHDSQNIRIIKSKTKHIACLGEMRNIYKIWSEKPKRNTTWKT